VPASLRALSRVSSLLWFARPRTPVGNGPRLGPGRLRAGGEVGLGVAQPLQDLDALVTGQGLQELYVEYLFSMALS